jgi:hypothetical protein
LLVPLSVSSLLCFMFGMSKTGFIFPCQKYSSFSDLGLWARSEGGGVDKTDSGWQRGCHAFAVHLFVGSKYMSVKWKKLVQWRDSSMRWIIAIPTCRNDEVGFKILFRFVGKEMKWYRKCSRMFCITYISVATVKSTVFTLLWKLKPILYGTQTVHAGYLR